MHSWSSQLHVTDVRQLGFGGHGQVYAAKLQCAAGISQDVVIKMVRGENPEEVSMGEQFLEEEARLLAKLLHHPNVIQLRDYNYAEIEGVQRPYLMLEHGGEPLAALMRAHGGRVEPGLAAYIAVEVLRGLAYAHEHDIVHRDVKPANVLIGWHGQVKLIDFGIAKAQDTRHPTTLGLLKGTPVYISPEGFRGEPMDGRADLWSVGVMLYEMLTGRPPWEVARGQAKAAYIRQISDLVFEAPVPALPEETVPRDLADVVDRLLRKCRDERYEDAMEAISAMQKVAVSLVAPWAAARELGQQACAAEPTNRGRALAPNASTVNMRSDKRSDDSMVLVAVPPSVQSIVVPPEMLDESFSMAVPPAMDSDVIDLAGPHATEQNPLPRAPRRARWLVAAIAAGVVLVGVAVGARTMRAAGASPRAAQAVAPSAYRPNGYGAAPTATATATVTGNKTLTTSSPLKVPREEGRVDVGLSDLAPSTTPASSQTATSAPTDTAPTIAGTAERKTPEQAVERAVLASLEVVVLPRGAYVSLDGNAPVRAPVTFSKLRQGVHSLRLGLDANVSDRTQRMRLKPGVNRLRVELANPFAAER